MKEKQLEYLDIQRMKVNGQKEFLHEAADETELCEVVKTEMQRAYGPWRAAYEEYVSRYETPLGNVDITKPIHQLDSQRDSVLFAIDVTARAALKSIDPQTVAAAEAVEQARVSFPVDPNAGYLSQTAQLDFYLAAMLGAQLENVTKIGALPLVQNLKAINDQIHALIDERDVERAGQLGEPGRTAARLAAVGAWDYLRRFVNGYNLVVVNPLQPNAQLDRFIDLMNVKIRRYRDIYIGAPAKPGDGENVEATEGEGETEEGSGSTGSGTNGGSTGSGGGSTDSGTGGSGSAGGSGSTGGNGSTDSGSTGSEEKYTVAWYLPNGNPIIWYELAPGETIPEAPTPPEGYYWHPYPDVMPNHDLDIIPEPIQG